MLDLCPRIQIRERRQDEGAESSYWESELLLSYEQYAYVAVMRLDARMLWASVCLADDNPDASIGMG